MEAMSVVQIRQRIDDILGFMQPYWAFVNCHMVNYLSEQHWERYIPEKLRLEVPNSERVQDCIKTVFWQDLNADASDKFPEFVKFVKLCDGQRLEKFIDILTTKEDLNKVLHNVTSNRKVSIKEFMSEKKRHEVEITAELVNNLIRSYAESDKGQEIYVVDAGDGKGYLSSRLALQYDHKVLGIDCIASNTQNALERNRKLRRAWNGLMVRAEIESEGLTAPRRGKKQKPIINDIQKNAMEKVENYKTSSQFISPTLNIVELVNNNFPKSNAHTLPAICLIGLHTCGNLASTCIEMFHVQPHCKILCNIGCCYHLLKELYSENENFENKIIANMQSRPGFPMSEFLKEKRVKLRRNARMLAAQSLERNRAARKNLNITLFYRALLEVLITNKMADDMPKVQVGKIRKFESFEEYVQLCCQKVNLNMTLFQTEEIAAIESRFSNDIHFMELFYLLRMLFAPIVETLILLDRLLYLKELKYEKSYLVPVFDAVVSPRRFGVIAFKGAHSKNFP